MRLQEIIFYLLLFVIAIFIDQFLKGLANLFLPIYLNKGIALGLFPTGVATLVTVGIIFLVLSVWREKIGWEMVLLIAGVVSNIIDRLRYGGVLDYIDVKILPVFNLADVFIVIGLIFTIKKLTGQKR